MPEKCKWEWQCTDDEYYMEYEDCYYKTACGHDFCFHEGDKRFRSFKWCPYCGKEIEECQKNQE